MAHADYRPSVLTENQSQSDSPYLSIVAASRNDDHGGDPLVRTQIFVNNLARQCERYKLPAELILIDWNPVQGRPGLAAVLKVPTETTFCQTRVITVPGALHRRLKYADRLPFFQMIAKNAGIRRARGRFILATNIDILFSDELIRFIARQKLDPEKLYRVDRYDIRSGLSAEHTLDESMEYAWAHPIRANRRYQPDDLIRDLYGDEVFKKSCIPSPPFRSPRDGVDVTQEDDVWEVRPHRSAAMTHLHTNACGDFTLLSREGWHAIRGYPEFEAFSWNIDSIGFVAAHYAGYQEVSLLPPCVCFHIEHGMGSGWTPEGETTLFDRLRQAQILNPEWPVLAPLVDEMREGQRALEFNHSGWGMAEFDLYEQPMGDSTEPPTEKLNQLGLFAEKKRISAIQPEFDLDRLTLTYERGAEEVRAMTSAPQQRPAVEPGPSPQQAAAPNPGFATNYAAVIAGVAYLIMLLCIWSPFAASSGMGWETYYTVKSELATSWENFLYTPDPLRIHAANFYELAYRLGDVLGIRGSFFPYQLIYAVLWWARSFLGFLIIRRLFPESLMLPFFIGAIMLVHAPDVLLGWLGQLHQFGYFVWLLTAVFLLVKALQAKSVSRAMTYAFAACPFVYLCLWTYEGPMFVIAATPFVLVFLIRPTPIRSAVWPAILWYIVPLIYVYLSYQRYLHLGGSAYQQALLRKSFAPTAILSDWFFNVRYSLSFWSWLHVDSRLSDGQIFVQTALLLIFFLAAAWFLARQELAVSPLFKRMAFRLLLSGLVLLFLSFPAQLLLEAARQPRRTQLLSAIAASMVLGAVVVLVAEILPRKGFRSVFAIALTVPIIWLGSWRTIEREGGHRAEWEVHLSAMKQLLRSVPRVQEGTVVVLTNVPKGPDPFYSYNFWFDNAMRLAYPGTTVAGIYYYDDGAAAPVANLQLRNGRWEYTGEGVSPLIQSAGIDQTLFLQYNPAGGEAKVLSDIPAFVCGDHCAGLSYSPEKRVLSGSPAPEPSRRYGPF